MACKECRGEVPKRETHCGGLQPSYCSDECRLVAKRRAYRNWRLRNLDQERLRERIHSKVHRERKRNTSRRWYAANIEARRAKARGRNRDTEFAADKKWRLASPKLARDKSRRAHSKRRARKKGAHVEAVNHRVVFDRDNGICGICKLPVEGKFEIDHVIPLSKGGAHSYQNVQLAHERCNRRKGAKLPESFQMGPECK